MKKECRKMICYGVFFGTLFEYAFRLDEPLYFYLNLEIHRLVIVAAL